MGYKTCSKCGKYLPIDNFYKKGRNSNEYRNYCKKCGNDWQLKYYSENREERNEYQKIYEKNKRDKNKKYKLEKEEIEELKKYREGERKVSKIISNKPVRNKNLPNDYKEYFKTKHEGKIYCECCREWQDIPEILEVHHIFELSKYEEKNYSTFEDVILLCPNCHKLAHLKGDLEEVKNILKNRNNFKNTEQINN